MEILQLPLPMVNAPQLNPQLHCSVNCLQDNSLAWTTQKTQPLLLMRHGSYPIVARIFVAAEVCFLSHCLAINVYSDFTVPAFGGHITILY
jgi:hypothetical protein